MAHTRKDPMQKPKPLEWYGPFCAAYKASRNFAQAAEAVGLSRSTVCDRKAHDPVFARMIHDIDEELLDNCEQLIACHTDVTCSEVKISPELALRVLRSRRPEKWATDDKKTGDITVNHTTILGLTLEDCAADAQEWLQRLRQKGMAS